MRLSIVGYTALTILTAATMLPQKAYSQRIVKIGQAEIAIQSPISFKRVDSLCSGSKPDENYFVKGERKYPKYFEESYIGFSLALPIDKDKYLPVYYGKSYSLEFGCRYFYKFSRHYALGTFAQYTFYNYKLKSAAEDHTFTNNIPGEVRREFYRTDNIGTGLINRFYLFPLNHNPFKLDLGGYVDYSYSKRYKVKTYVDGDKEKFKYRSCSKFNPVQAGLYGAISKNSCSLFVRYRLTNLFDPDQISAELPRISLGIQFNLD